MRLSDVYAAGLLQRQCVDMCSLAAISFQCWHVPHSSPATSAMYLQKGAPQSAGEPAAATSLHQLTLLRRFCCAAPASAAPPLLCRLALLTPRPLPSQRQQGSLTAAAAHITIRRSHQRAAAQPLQQRCRSAVEHPTACGHRREAAAAPRKGWSAGGSCCC